VAKDSETCDFWELRRRAARLRFWLAEKNPVNEDHELIAECLNGRTSAFGLLVGRYQNRLYNALTKILGSAEDAHDVSQEAFVHAFQKLHTFQGNSRFYSWLFRIALNSAVSFHRKRHRNPASIEAVREQTGIEPIDSHPDAQPESAMERSERQDVVRQALADLPGDFRQVLVLKEIEGMKYEEIAEIMECPVGTVRSRIHRARAELKTRLETLLKSEVR